MNWPWEFDTWLLIATVVVGSATVVAMDRSYRETKRKVLARKAQQQEAGARELAEWLHALSLRPGVSDRGPLEVCVHFKDKYEDYEYVLKPTGQRYVWEVSCREHPEVTTTASGLDWLQTWALRHAAEHDKAWREASEEERAEWIATVAPTPSEHG